MTDDMMMGERDLEAEVKEKDEIIMSLRLNEHLLKDKLEISRRNMSMQLERITALENENEQLRENLHNCRLNKNIISEKLKLWQDVHKEYNIYSIKDFEELLNEQQSKIRLLEKENEKLLKQINDCKDYNALLYQNSMKSDKAWIKNVQKPLEKELEESIQESTELRKQNMELDRRVHILSAILLSDECSLSEKRIREIKEELFE